MKSWMAWLVAAAGLATGAAAEEITSAQAGTAARNWVDRGYALGKLPAGRTVAGVDDLADPVTGVRLHVVRFEGGGYVVTSGDDLVEPVLAFSETGDTVDLDEQNPFWGLLRADISAREAAVGIDRIAASPRPAARTSKATAGTEQQPSEAQRRWAELLSDDAVNSSHKRKSSSEEWTPSDLRVDSFVQSQWNQNDVNGMHCYDYYTPKHYPCGCSITTLGQIMRYWEYPSTVVPRTNECVVDGYPTNKAMIGGQYVWTNMPLTPSATNMPTEIECEAIGRLLYDVGVASKAGWHGKGTGGICSGLVLRDYFDYANGTDDICWRYWSIDEMKNALIPNLDARCPVGLSVGESLSGAAPHAVVGDGYGYSCGDLFIHINYGWGGTCNAWYRVPDLATADSDFPDYTIMANIYCNVHPRQKGNIVSGRVFDLDEHACPVPVSNAMVFLRRGDVVLAWTNTDHNGIYAFISDKEEPLTIESTDSNLTGVASVMFEPSFPAANKCDIDIIRGIPVQTPPQVTVTLDNQDGSFGEVTATYGSILPLIPQAQIPSREGFRFGGYYSTPEFRGIQYYNADGESHLKWDKITPTTLYAYWIDEGALQWGYRMENGKAIVMNAPTNELAVLSIPEKMDRYPVKSIGRQAFDGALNLQEVIIPMGVTDIGDYAFRNCSRLTSVTIPNSVTDIGNVTFNFTALRSVTIPASVTNVGRTAFGYCSRLEQIQVDDENPKFSSQEGVLFSKDGSMLICFPGGKSVGNYTIPNSVRNIGNEAFAGCNGLTSVTIPNSVTNIEGSAFHMCSNLESVKIPDSVITIGNPIFSSCFSLKQLEVPAVFWGRLTVPKGCVVVYRGIEPLEVTTKTLPEGMVGKEYRTVLEANGGFWPYTWKDEGTNGLPPWLELEESGALRGTPPAAGEYSFSVSVKDSKEQNVTTHLTLSARNTGGETWIPESFVALDTQGGASEQSVVLARRGQAMPTVSVPTKEGYTFCGYFSGLKGTGTQYYTAEGTSARNWDRTEDATLYASWKVHFSVVVLDKQEGTRGTSEVRAFPGEPMPSVEVPTKTGYTFVGYYSGLNGAGTPYYTAEGRSARNWDRTEESTATLYAKWRGNTYVATLAHQEGVGGTTCVNMEYGAVPSPVDIPIREGYDFVGYYAGQGGIGTKYYNSNGQGIRVWNVESNTTIYAHWMEKSEITWGYRIENGKVIVTNATPVQGKLTIPETLDGYPVEEIDTCAFKGESMLLALDIPSSVKRIGSSAFSDCKRLGAVTIQNGMTSIGGDAFKYCQELTWVSIPASVTSIGASAFGACYNLESVNVDSGNPCFTSEDGVLLSKDKTTLVCCPGGKSGRYEISGSVTNIAQSAFFDCKGLTSLEIPDGMTSIGFLAFGGCSSLKSLSIPDSVVSFGSYAFWCCIGLTNIDVPGTWYGPSNDNVERSDKPKECDVLYRQTVVFKANDGTGGEQKETKFIGRVYGTLPEATRTGHAFLGWFTEGGEEVTETSVAPEDVTCTLYAHWAPKSYCVTLERDGGTGGAESALATYGEISGKVEIPVWKGYAFGGYYTEKNGGGAQYYAADGTGMRIWDRDEDTTLHAKWSLIEVSLAEALDNGTLAFTSEGMPSWKGQQAESHDGEDAAWCANPTRDTDGWATSALKTDVQGPGRISFWWRADGELGVVQFKADDQTEKTLRGTNRVWDAVSLDFADANVHRIAWQVGRTYYDAGGYSVTGWVDEVTWTPGNIITLDPQNGETNMPTVLAIRGEVLPPVEVPTMAGGVFRGYYLGKNGVGAQWYSASGECDGLLWDGSSGITLYACWATNQVTTFVGNGGTPETQITTNRMGQAHGTLPTAERSGYEFAGWFTQASGGVQVTAEGTVTEAVTRKLYAHWTPKTYSVTLNRQGGTGGAASAVATYGEFLPPLEIPAREGYDFAGYFTAPDGGGTQYYDADGKGTRAWDKTRDTTLHAKWSIPLAVALDNVSLSFVSEGMPPWLGQQAESHDGEDAAQCANPTRDTDGWATSTLKTTVEGPGRLSFWWKADGENGTFHFNVDDQTENTLRVTNRTWEAVSRDFADADSHQIEWQVGRTYYDASGYSVTGWVDEVMWTPGCIVTLDPQNGDANRPTVLGIPGEGLPDVSVPTREGHAFAGYYRGPDGTGVRYTTASGAGDVPWSQTGTATLYAKWTPLGPITVPHGWLDERASSVLTENGGDYEAAAMSLAANGRPLWECYVAALDPGNATAKLEIKEEAFGFDEDGVLKLSIAVPPDRVGVVKCIEGLAGAKWEEVAAYSNKGPETVTYAYPVPDNEAGSVRFYRVALKLLE